MTIQLLIIIVVFAAIGLFGDKFFDRLDGN